MKKYLVFIAAFIILLTVVQIGSGLVLTALYAPDIADAGQTANGAAVFGFPPIVTFSVLLLIATLAFAASQKFPKA
jgi:hypothetical protein